MIERTVLEIAQHRFWAWQRRTAPTPRNQLRETDQLLGAVEECRLRDMGSLIGGPPGSRPVSDLTTVPLRRRMVESAATMRPGGYAVCVGRPERAAGRGEWDQAVALPRCARRAVVATPDTTPLPQE